MKKKNARASLASLTPLLITLLAGGCHHGLGEPPAENGREELTLRPSFDEGCASPELAAATPPAHLLEPGRSCDREREGFCFRLTDELREAAAAHDPHGALLRSARAFDRYLVTGERAELERARAFADLAVSGRQSYAAFAAAPPSVGSLAQLPGDDAARPSDGAIELALDRAYAAAWALRGPVEHRAQARPALGWIAVSPEDDLPTRPVNVAAGPFPQSDVSVAVPTEAGDPRAVRVRVLVASSAPASDAPVPAVLSEGVPLERSVQLPDAGPVMLFLHGHSSLAEEGAPVAAELVRAYEARGEALTVVLVDLPSNAYADRLDPEALVEQMGGGDDALLRFLDAFVIAFVDTLEAITPGLSERIEAVIGGSLGGNLVLRLAERGDELPWVRRAVAWSPASIDYSWSHARLASASTEQFQDLVKHEAVRLTRREAAEPEKDDSRRDYFVGGLMSLSSQSGYWYRESWGACRDQLIDEGMRQIGEVYDERMRRWHYRVAYEQLMFSHIEGDFAGDAPRFQRITAPLLLVVGAADNSIPMQTWFFAERLAPHLTMPGRTLFLEDTGHAMHSERPAYLASQIEAFVTE